MRSKYHERHAFGYGWIRIQPAPTQPSPDGHLTLKRLSRPGSFRKGLIDQDFGLPCAPPCYLAESRLRDTKGEQARMRSCSLRRGVTILPWVDPGTGVQFALIGRGCCAAVFDE